MMMNLNAVDIAVFQIANNQKISGTCIKLDGTESTQNAAKGKLPFFLHF